MDAQLDKQKLFQKAKKSCKIIRESLERFGKDKIAVSWSGNFESILLLHLIKEEYGDIPLPVVHFDSSLKYEAFHVVRDKIVRDWNLNLVVELMEINEITGSEGEDHKRSQVMDRYGWQALIIPVIAEELSAEPADNKFTKFDNPAHVAVAPILHFKTTDIQNCMEMYGMQDSAPHDRDSSDPEDPDQEEEIKRRLRDLGYL